MSSTEQAIAKVDAYRARRIAKKLQQPPDWRAELEQRGERYAGHEANVLRALRTAPELHDLLRFDEFRQFVEFGRVPPWRKLHLGDRWTDEDDLHLQVWLQGQRIDVRQRHVVADCVLTVARDWTVHPVRQYLERLTWDSEPRLQLWLAEYLGAVAPPDYLAAIGTKFLISAVARIMAPGCQADHVLTLEGPQGAGKSRTVQILGAPWTTDGLPDLHSKDAAIHLSAVWLVELAELAALRKSELEGVKAFLTRRVDRYRPPYGRREVAVPRQCVFIATTNEGSYLRDPSGNRRFWPVRCGRIDLAALERDRDQLLAEAMHRYAQGDAWHPTGAEVELTATEQESRLLLTELEQLVADFAAQLEAAGTRETTMRAVLEACGLERGSGDYVERAGRLGPQVSAALHRAGWERVRATGRGASRRVLYQLHRGS